MADITDKVAQIRQAVYGKDVRESIASGIEAINSDVENAMPTMNQIKTDTQALKDATQALKDQTQAIKNQIPVENATAEIIDARGGFDTLRHKLDSYCINVKDFGAAGDGETDDTAALQAARDYIAAQDSPSRLVFPAGIYKYSDSPNWAIQDAEIIADGEVRLRYTGTEDAVIIDGGLISIYNLTFGKFIVECPSAGKNAVYINNVHHSKISVNCKGAGIGYAGLRIDFAVCDLFEVIVSNNEEGWYQNAPSWGVWCSQKSDALPTSYCLFLNPILEGTPYGCYLENALGCLFIGGTMEGCGKVGCQLGPGARLNTLINVDFESNTDSDINCNGHDNEFISCDSDSLVIFDLNSYQNSIIGGAYSEIIIGSGAVGNAIIDTKYNRFNTSKAINDQGTKTRLSNNYNVGLGRFENYPPAKTVITIDASPFTYTNNSGNTEKIMIVGGTISSLVYMVDGIGEEISPITNGFFLLEPTDGLIVTYTVAPTIIKYSV